LWTELRTGVPRLVDPVTADARWLADHDLDLDRPYHKAAK
jgi:hypothetical protein